MKTLYYSIIAIFSIIFIFSNNAVFADNIKSTDSFLQQCNDNMQPIPTLKPASVNSSSPKLGILVMQPNSVATVCMKYVKLYHGNSSFETNNTQLIPSIGIEDIQVRGSQISFGTIPVNNVVAKAQQKIISFGSQENASTVISYTLSTKPDSIGYYHVGIPYMCGNILLAVGYPISQIDASSFQDVNPMCFNYGVETSIAGIQGANMTYVNISNKTIHSTKLPENISIIPPLQQMRIYDDVRFIRCNPDLQLIFKSENASPACVKPDTTQKLVERGWHIHYSPRIGDHDTSKEKMRTKDSQAIPHISDNSHNWTYLADEKISSIKISSDDSLIVVGTETDNNKGSVYLFDNQGLLLWQKTIDRRIGDVAISPDNSFISASGFQLSSGRGQFYENGKIYLFDMKGNQLWNHEAKGYEAMSSTLFNPDDSVVTTINDTVIDFDKKGNTIWKFATNDYLRNISASQDGSFVAAYSGSKIYFLDNHGQLLWTFATDYKNIDRVILSHDGRYVVVGDATNGYEGTIYFLDNTGKILWKNPVGGPLLSVSISKDYSIAATNNWQTYLFDSKGMQLWKDNIPSLVTISSDGSFVVGMTYANGTNRITFFDRQGNIASDDHISDYTSTFTLSQDDKYFVIANRQDHNQVSFFELEQNISHQNIVANLTSMQTSNQLHLKVVPKVGISFDVQIGQGKSIQIPWDIKLDDNYTTMNLEVSVQSPPGLESWIAPIDPYTIINGVPPGDKLITIHPTFDIKPGNYTVKVIGQGNAIDPVTGWITDLDNKTLGMIHVSVKPSNDKISIHAGVTRYEIRTLCVNLEPSGQSCGSGPIYEEVPLTIYSNSTQTVKITASGLEEGEWVKFIPDQVVAGPNGSVVKMIIAGYEVPVLKNSLADKPLIIQVESPHETQTTIISVMPHNLISILHSPSPIKLGAITTNSYGVNFGTSGAVYDPLDNSNATLPVKLSVLGLLNGNSTISLPSWISVDIPNSSFILNATQPYYFMTTVKTSNAPPSGTYNIAIDENIGGQHFVQPEEIIIENTRY